MQYKTRIITTDNVIQYYVYEKPIDIKFKSKRIDYSKSTEGEKKQSSLNRARDNLILTIESNLTTYTKFLTLTCKDNIYDRERFLTMFKIFKKQFKKIFNCDLKYVSILERQFKRQKKFNLPDAPWHIHLIVFNVQKLEFKALKNIWGKYGSLDIKKVDDHKNLSLYFAKYLTQDNVAINKKAIMKSRNLKSPNVVHTEESIIPNDYTYRCSYLVYQKPQVVATLTKELEYEVIEIEEYNHCDFYEIRLNKRK